MTPVASNSNQTEVTYCTEADLGGSLPGFAIKKANEDQGQQTFKVGQVMPKYLSKRSANGNMESDA